MKLSYQHANPYSGCESVLLRIEGLLPHQTVCILIDSGDDVNVDELLDEDEYLTAICLTHAHYDHYQSLDSNLRDGAPVYATPDTTQLLEASYQVGKPHSAVDHDSVLSAVTPIDGWTTIVDGLRVRALPAGHAPGAASLLFAIDDGNQTRTVLATGDFTLRRTAGYSGFDADLPLDIDVCLLSATASEDFESAATRTVKTISDRATAGSTVLVTAGGQMGLHLGYLLSRVSTEYGREFPITLVGQTAILAERLNYDLPGVSTVPEFDSPSAVLAPGEVTIAGPDVPTADSATSAARLFEQIRTDDAATLVQIPAGGGPPVTAATCTVYSFPLKNHPRRSTIDRVIKSLAPIHLIILHETGSAADQYKDHYSSYVWATNDRLNHTLLNETGWTPPPWVSDQVERYVTRQRIDPRQPISSDVLTADAESEFPSNDRCETPDLEREGIATQAISRETAMGRTDTVDEKYRAKETDDAATEPSSTVVERLEVLNDRIAELESMIDRQFPEQGRRSARVLDVQNGVTILRLDEEINVEPGDTVDILPSS
ncbi:MBL fold metallo-hydrolase [Halocatena pleomorpha]|uniref:MBL fold metallo-hydrolase n=1 Tax=Halocatena pleomorpha TaxID=1785090 RepID=A0A3P3REX3_9EURY|nr:MBL fold metallo-hydrolase [Halocatena pleomorpha]RRJ31518.1 MBL fold metallo-hydrolase [Halocatena pleomorpha]